MLQTNTTWETECPKSDDSQHCSCWYDGQPCCRCGNNDQCSIEAATLAARKLTLIRGGKQANKQLEMFSSSTEGNQRG